MKIFYNGQVADTDLKFSELDSELEIESPAYKFRISCRPHYCDRGRFLVYAENKSELYNPFDSADGFPRYYFNLQRCLDELKDLIEFREKKIVFSPQTPNHPSWTPTE